VETSQLIQRQSLAHKRSCFHFNHMENCHVLLSRSNISGLRILCWYANKIHELNWASPQQLPILLLHTSPQRCCNRECSRPLSHLAFSDWFIQQPLLYQSICNSVSLCMSVMKASDSFIARPSCSSHHTWWLRAMLSPLARTTSKNADVMLV
jgi:hypothetical protein